MAFMVVCTASDAVGLCSDKDRNEKFDNRSAKKKRGRQIAEPRSQVFRLNEERYRCCLPHPFGT